MKFEIFKQFPRLKYVVTTRHGGISSTPYDSLNLRYEIGDDPVHVLENRKRACDLIGATPDRLISAIQTHSKNVYVYRKGEDFPIKELEDFDAFVTNVSGAALLVQIADCQGVILYDAKNHAVGVVHSGWKGSVKNVIGETLRIMREEYGTNGEDVYAGISPSLGPCCCEFTDPRLELPEYFHQYILDGNHVNFWEASRGQMHDFGIPDQQIELAHICTSDTTDTYFSYRKSGGETGRFGVMAMLE